MSKTREAIIKGKSGRLTVGMVDVAMAVSRGRSSHHHAAKQEVQHTVQPLRVERKL